MKVDAIANHSKAILALRRIIAIADNIPASEQSIRTVFVLLSNIKPYTDIHTVENMSDVSAQTSTRRVHIIP